VAGPFRVFLTRNAINEGIAAIQAMLDSGADIIMD
jgi:hypothetical protein